MKYKIASKKLSYLFLSFAFISSLISCEQVESEPDDSDIIISEVTGKWVVDIIHNGELTDSNTISTYNTGANDSDMMWVDDLQHGFWLKAKVSLSLGDLTFGGSDLDELYDPGVTVTITEGKIVKDGATTPSGDIVDSIYFKAVFSNDDPNSVWEYSGYKSTAKINDLP